MSIHPTLSSAGKHKRHRSVLKRFERILTLKKEGKWKEGNSIFGLPKVKLLKIKVKKEKPAEAAPAEAPAEEAPAREVEAKKEKESK